LARHRFVMKGYPEDMLMPGEPRVTVARPKGISDLDKRERVILADALRSGRLTIERQKKWRLGYVQINSLPIRLANHFIDQKSPIIFGEAPPEESLHSHGRRMLVDGTIDRQGIARRGPGAASTKVKQPK
ncbi:hypothetical protein BD769DRAFT_1339872, partial [Suillus cothurnatus]